MVKYLKKILGINALDERIAQIENRFYNAQVMVKELQHIKAESQRYDETERVRKLRRKGL